MSELINIYNDSESAIIIDETTTSLTQVEQFPTLGVSPFNESMTDNLNQLANKNFYFIELNVFDENEQFIVKLNSAKPLLKNPSTNEFYFGDFHIHDDIYMTGIKHVATPHQVLEVDKKNQFIPYPMENRLYQDEFQSIQKTFAIKTSEIFYVLKHMPNFNLEKDTKFFMNYAVFQDAFILTRNRFVSGDIE